MRIVLKPEDIAKAAIQRQNNELDSIIIIDGNRGAGKSTLAWKILRKTKKFKPRKDIMFTRSDVMNAIMERKFSTIDADEMINSAHNRDFFSGDQKTFIKVMNMYRDNFNILIGSVPFFYDLDSQVRKLVKLRITIIKRGLGVVQMAKPSLYGNDPWETNRNRKIEESWIETTRSGKPYRKQYHKLSTFKGYIVFPAMTKWEENLYKALKEEKRNQLKLKDDKEKPKEYWVEANDLIEEGKIKRFKDLEFYLMGKGILKSTGKARVRTYRNDMNLKPLKELWEEAKEEKKRAAKSVLQ